MNTSSNRQRKDPSMDREEPPPFMRSWNNIYVAIVIYTCVLIMVLYLVTVFLNH